MLKFINKFFKLPIHPFNLAEEGVKTYGEWQFEKGQDTIKFYLEYSKIEEMFENKTILDIGCGVGGKSLYYASCNAKMVYGIDVVEEYKKESEILVGKLESRNNFLKEHFKFSIMDAAKLEFEDNFFDTIIMNDAMEHVDNPLKVLNECFRVLKKGGKLYINFPPYNHPYGAHLSDVIAIPWVHVFFSEKTLIKNYKELVSPFKDAQRRIKFRISEKNGKEYFSYINKMSIRRFNRIYKSTKFKLCYYNEVPLRNIFALVARMPLVKEFFVKMVVCVFEK